MQCPLCQADNPPSADHCTKCSTPLPFSDATISPTAMDGTPVGRTEAWSVAVTPRPSSEAASKGQLEPGTVLADRFEIIQLLGQGGMGAVYKGRDIELDRLVALKLIRPDLASHPEILRRFKQELILAREVTHRNVIRIFDLGQAQGIKFITMEYVEGRDLRTLIHEKEKMAAEEAVPIVLQIAAALEAAHHAGVVHRDLKPQNVMTDKDGRVYVMDFGIARSLETPGMTQTGALMGTPEYMSPEQAKGEKVDARSDLFALGIIFYEMLTGISPFKADTAMAMMFKRTQERATPLAQLNLGVPGVISDIVSKCLEIKPDERYQTARAIIDDLEAWKGGVPHGTIVPASRRIRYAPNYQKWLIVGGAAAVLALAVYAFHDKFTSRSSTTSVAPMQAVSLAILPFHNSSSDVSADWMGPSLADMLSREVGQSVRLHTVSPDRLHQILRDSHIPTNADFDADMLRQLAELSSADFLVWGRYAKFGDQIRIDATLGDFKNNRRTPLKIEVPGEKDFLAGVHQLSDLIRNNLAVSSDVLKELKASSFQLSSQSVPALRDYDQSLELLRDGKNLEAVKSLQAAIKEDPQFALAYSRLAATQSELGYDADAERNSRKAVELSQQLPLGEKYLIEANHARLMKDNKKAIDAYENLAKTFPNNADVEYELGSLYSDKGDYDKARAQFLAILKTDPKNIKALWKLGVVEINRDNPQAALEPLNQGLSLAVQVDNQEQKALILLAMGISYRLMNKPEEAIRNYQQSMEITHRLGLKRTLAGSLSEMAQVQNTLGKPKDALASYNQALDILREIGMKKEIGDALINRGVLYQTWGEYDKALQDNKDSLQIQREADDENYQALCLSNIGSVYLAKGDTDNALTYLQQALQLRQKLNDPEYVAQTLSALGDVYTATGDYDKAVSTLVSALDISHKSNNLRGAAAESHQMGTVLVSQGRLGSAVSAMQDAVKNYQASGYQGRELIDAWNDLAGTLALAGRGAESAKPLEDAQGLARDLKNPSVDSAISSARGDVEFYSSNLKAAKPAYDQALRSATQGKDRDQILTAKLSLARLAIAEGRSQAAIPDLRAIIQQADGLNLKYLSLKASVDLAQAMINTKDNTRARQELERDLGRSEKLGSRLETARIHYLLGDAMRLTADNPGAAGQYQQALRLFDALKKEQGAEHLFDRSDLHTMYAEASRWVASLRG
jgi:tetratricopeptide (TPR) repeat protein/predicted Ser/Thr protein kinase/TolB-like protein